MKKINIISIVVISILFLSCGFKTINQKNTNLVYLKNINISGERRIAYSLKNDLLLLSNENSKNKFNVEIKLSKKRISKIKDTAGKVTRYNLSLSADLKMISLDTNKKLQNQFTRTLDYDVAKIHSDTINNENSAVKSITQQISNDIDNFINLMMRNR